MSSVGSTVPSPVPLLALPTLLLELVSLLSVLSLAPVLLTTATMGSLLVSGIAAAVRSFNSEDMASSIAKADKPPPCCAPSPSSPSLLLSSIVISAITPAACSAAERYAFLATVTAAIAWPMPP